MSQRQGDGKDQWRDMYGQTSNTYSTSKTPGRRIPPLPAVNSLISDDEDVEGFSSPRISRRQGQNGDQRIESGRNFSGQLDYSRNYPTASHATVEHGSQPSIDIGMDYSVDNTFAAARNYAADVAGSSSFGKFVADAESSDSFSTRGSDNGPYASFAKAPNSNDQQDLRTSPYGRDISHRSSSDEFGGPSNNLQRASSDMMGLKSHHGVAGNTGHHFGITGKESFDSGNSYLQQKMPGVSEESGIAGVSTPYPTLGHSKDDSMERSSSRRNLILNKPVPKEGRAMPPPSDTVEPVMPKPRLSRRWNSGTPKRRQPDLMRGVNTVKTRDKSAIPPDEHVVGCLHCRKFCQVKKAALLVTCASCNKVSPASQSNKASQ